MSDPLSERIERTAEILHQFRRLRAQTQLRLADTTGDIRHNVELMLALHDRTIGSLEKILMRLKSR